MRREFSKKVMGQAALRANGQPTQLTCFYCGQGFERPYRLSARRLARRVFCSPACDASARAASADRSRQARFWSKVQKGSPTECWPWQAQRDQNGYGKFQWSDGKPVLAHRAAHIFASGVDPGDLDVCHDCDNPPCCNPSHLWSGTAKDNVADMIAKGRRRSTTRRGEDSNKAKITAQQAREIYASSEPRSSLAVRYGITGTAVYLIKRGINWAHATGAKR